MASCRSMQHRLRESAVDSRSQREHCRDRPILPRPLATGVSDGRSGRTRSWRQLRSGEGVREREEGHARAHGELCDCIPKRGARAPRPARRLRRRRERRRHVAAHEHGSADHEPARSSGRSGRSRLDHVSVRAALGARGRPHGPVAQGRLPRPLDPLGRRHELGRRRDGRAQGGGRQRARLRLPVGPQDLRLPHRPRVPERGDSARPDPGRGVGRPRSRGRPRAHARPDHGPAGRDPGRDRRLSEDPAGDRRRALHGRRLRPQPRDRQQDPVDLAGHRDRRSRGLEPELGQRQRGRHDPHDVPGLHERAQARRGGGSLPHARARPGARGHGQRRGEPRRDGAAASSCRRP